MKHTVQGWLRRLGYTVVPEWRASHFAQAQYLSKLFELTGIDCVLDVGANTGQYRDFLRMQVGYSGRIVSFEPIPECFEELRGRSASDSNWEVQRLALGARAGTAVFNVMHESQFSSLLEPDATITDRFSTMNSVSRRIEVEVRPLADLLSSIRRGQAERIYLKLDTQGFDLEVIRGAGVEINNIEAVQTEVSFTRLYEGAPSWTAALDLLTSCGFRLSGMFPNNPQHFPELHEVDCHVINQRWTPPISTAGV